MFGKKKKPFNPYEKRADDCGASSFLSRGKFNKFSYEFLCKMPIDKNPIVW